MLGASQLTRAVIGQCSSLSWAEDRKKKNQNKVGLYQQFKRWNGDGAPYRDEKDLLSENKPSLVPRVVGVPRYRTSKR